jgi:hypothetical protein
MSQPLKVTEKNEIAKSTSSQLAMDQMQRRSESMASMLSQIPADQVDEPEFKKLKNGCDVSLTAQRPTAIVVKNKGDDEKIKGDDEKIKEEEMSDPWSKMPSNQIKTNKMIRSTTFG